MIAGGAPVAWDAGRAHDAAEADGVNKA